MIDAKRTPTGADTSPALETGSPQNSDRPKASPRKDCTTVRTGEAPVLPTRAPPSIDNAIKQPSSVFGVTGSIELGTPLLSAICRYQGEKNYSFDDGVLNAIFTRAYTQVLESGTSADIALADEALRATDRAISAMKKESTNPWVNLVLQPLAGVVLAGASAAITLNLDSSNLQYAGYGLTGLGGAFAMYCAYRVYILREEAKDAARQVYTELFVRAAELNETQ